MCRFLRGLISLRDHNGLRTVRKALLARSTRSLTLSLARPFNWIVEPRCLNLSIYSSFFIISLKLNYEITPKGVYIGHHTGYSTKFRRSMVFITVKPSWFEYLRKKFSINQPTQWRKIHYSELNVPTYFRWLVNTHPSAWPLSSTGHTTQAIL